MTDTIFALSSGRPPSGVAVIRMSGPTVRDTLQILAGMVPEPRYAALRKLRDPKGLVLDHALVLYFAGPKSETGEDCGEFHLHGGRAVVAKVLEVLSALPGLRMAEPGEFIRRSFLNGKLDLVGVEALGDLISAETELQRRFAIECSGAAQSKLYARWRMQLLRGRALVEAELDFADEADVHDAISAGAWASIAEIRDEMRAHVDGYRRAEIVKEGFRVVLAGAPNAGKSSLLNALARRDVAIVSDEPGTTRDVLEVQLDLNGIKVVLADTAGLRENARGVEAIGIGKSKREIAAADMVLMTVPVDGGETFFGSGGNAIVVRTKIDLASEVFDFGDQPAVSAVTGAGLDNLLLMMERAARESIPAEGQVLPTRLRQVQLFEYAIGSLDRVLEDGLALELRAEALRVTERSIGQVIGSVDAEDLLGEIFGQFCIGK
jgi:tRNA modification GTPase